MIINYCAYGDFFTLVLLLSSSCWSQPEQDVYTMVTDVCFLEFIPLEKVDDPQPETLFMDQVRLGYTIVVYKNIALIQRQPERVTVGPYC